MSVQLTCQACGATFEMPKWRLRVQDGKYCSHSCYVSDRRARSVSLEERLWSRVVKTDSCWLWTGARSPSGYGSMTHDRQRVSVHRAAYELTYGPIPEGKQVLHHCDTPLCVRPDHLFLGTDAVNMADKVSKARQTRGEQIPQAVLTEAQVIAIRTEYAAGGVSLAALGRRYGVHFTTIRDIVLRNSWKHLP